jgi:putative ABC transport system permease protein
MDEQPFTGTYAIGIQTFEDNIPNSGDNMILVKLQDGASPAEARSEIDSIVSTYPSAKLQDLSEFKDSFKSQLNVFLIMMGVLLAFTILIAMIGITNTLILSVVERMREIGLTRAVGAYRGQIRSTIRWEALIIALFGLTAALGIGIFFGWMLITNSGDEGIDAFSLPVVHLVILTIVTAFLTLGAAMLPAAWAGRRPILQAIASE